jgi:hypothetical protein
MKKKGKGLKINPILETRYLISKCKDRRYITSLVGGDPTYSQRPPFLLFTAAQAKMLKRLLGTQSEEASSSVRGRFVTPEEIAHLLQRMSTLIEDLLDKDGNARFKR